MFNRHSSGDKKIITKSLCIIAFAVPFICPLGETKASEIISGENKFFVGNLQSESLQFKHKFNEHKFNSNYD